MQEERLRQLCQIQQSELTEQRAGLHNVELLAKRRRKLLAWLHRQHTVERGFARDNQDVVASDRLRAAQLDLQVAIDRLQVVAGNRDESTGQRRGQEIIIDEQILAIGVVRRVN